MGVVAVNHGEAAAFGASLDASAAALQENFDTMNASNQTLLEVSTGVTAERAVELQELGRQNLEDGNEVIHLVRNAVDNHSQNVQQGDITAAGML